MTFWIEILKINTRVIHRESFTAYLANVPRY